MDGQNYEEFPLYDLSNCTTSEKCTKIEIILGILANLDGKLGFGFGTTLRNFIELSSFDSFSVRQKLFNIYFDKVYFGNLEDYCEHLKDDEKKLHEIFSNLSTIIGFSTSEAMSLYDIPAILSDPSSENGKDELLLGNMPKSFYYSRCKHGFKYESLKICGIAWHNHIERISNGNKTGNKHYHLDVIFTLSFLLQISTSM